MNYREGMEAVRKRIASEQLKGEMCNAPGCTQTENLHVDHVYGQRSWDNANYGWQRWKRYMEELNRGEVLQLLCAKHNLRKGAQAKNKGIRKKYHVTDRKCFCDICRPRDRRR